MIGAARFDAGRIAGVPHSARNLSFSLEVISMKRIVLAVFTTVLLTGPARPTWADEKDPQAVLDKAIKALGGEEKLQKATISFGGNENEMSFHSTVQGLDHYRGEIEGKFGENEFKGVVVLNGDKGWRVFGEKMDMDEDAVSNEKRRLYVDAAAARVLPLKEKGFKVELAGEEKVGDKPTAVIKATGPDGKDLKLYFDKESGLPVKMVAKMVGFQGEEYEQETTYKDYKDFDGIKVATKHESKRDGESFFKSEITEFKVLDKVDGKTFAEPE
jgi:hypothetical protein